WMIAGILWVPGCSFLSNPGRDQCHSSEDCSEAATGKLGLECRSGLCLESKDPWACIGQIVPPTGDPMKTSPLDLVIIDSITRVPQAGVSIRFCRAIDLDCRAPVANATTDENGMLSLNVPQETQGYFEGQGDPNIYLPAVAAIANTSTILALSSPRELRMVRKDTYRLIALQANVEPDFSLGQIMFVVIACPGTKSAAGIEV